MAFRRVKNPKEFACLRALGWEPDELPGSGRFYRRAYRGMDRTRGRDTWELVLEDVLALKPRKDKR